MVTPGVKFPNIDQNNPKYLYCVNNITIGPFANTE